MRRRRTLAVASLVLLSATARARGTAQEKAVASQLFDDAERLIAEGKVADACPKYAESHELDPQIGTLLHLGDCYEKLGKTASAWATFKDASELATQRQDPRVTKIQEHLRSLEASVPKIVLTVSSARGDIQVRQDGQVVRRALWGSTVPIDPGAHRFDAEAPGLAPWSTTLQIPANSSTTQVVVPELLPPGAKPAPVADAAAPAPAAPAAADSAAAGPAPAPDPAAAADAPTPSGSPGSTQRILGWSGVGIGAVGIVVGAVFMGQKGSKLDERDAICPSGQNCTPAEAAAIANLTDDARSANTIGWIGLAGGTLLAAGGLALVLTAPRSTATPAETVALVPALGPGFGGISVAGRL